jgi:uncharacterized membrane protein YdjX (TVP38/TMEM64 family)
MRRRLITLVVLLAAAAALLMAGREGVRFVPRFAAWVDGLGPWGMAAYIAGYGIATVAFIPGSVLTVAAGALFGVVRGTVVAFIGATLGSTLAFLVSRYLARPWVVRRAAQDRRIRRLDRAVGVHGFRLVFLLRLSPVLPFTLMNYALGITRVRFRDYLLASAGMLPGTLLYVYTGKVAGDVAAAAGGAPVHRGPGYWLVIGLGFIATLAVTLAVSRIARRALREADER